MNRSEMDALGYCVLYLQKGGSVNCSEFQVHHGFNLGVGVATAIIGSYILQVVYRIVLYVSFGSRPSDEV
jgi:hypothetical protein